MTPQQIAEAAFVIACIALAASVAAFALAVIL